MAIRKIWRNLAYFFDRSPVILLVLKTTKDKNLKGKKNNTGYRNYFLLYRGNVCYLYGHGKIAETRKNKNSFPST